MASDASKLLAEALALPADERAEMVDALLRSLDDGDDLDEADRKQLHEALLLSDQQLRAGERIPASDVLAALAKR